MPGNCHWNCRSSSLPVCNSERLIAMPVRASENFPHVNSLLREWHGRQNQGFQGALDSVPREIHSRSGAFSLEQRRRVVEPLDRAAKKILGVTGESRRRRHG